MAINFPDSPVDGELYTENGATFQWVAAKMAWVGVPTGINSVQGTPNADEIATWFDNDTIRGATNLYWDGTTLGIGGVPVTNSAVSITGTDTRLRFNNTSSGTGTAFITGFGFNSGLQLSADPTNADAGTYISFSIDGTEIARFDDLERLDHPSANQAWITYDQTSGATIDNDYNYSSITDQATGRITYSFTNNFFNANWTVTGLSGAKTGFVARSLSNDGANTNKSSSGWGVYNVTINNAAVDDNGCGLTHNGPLA